MSGAQLGGIVGGIVGAVWGGGNWQLGYAIGSAIGGYVDPDRIKGPSIGDIARQTANEGIACPLFAGTAGAAGNLIYKSEVRRVTVEERQGKGGPIVESERLYCTFAIRIGASLFYGPGNRTGLVGLSRIWEDEKLVYDVRPGSTMLADSAKWASDADLAFYPGNDTQLPDPVIESIEGVGNVPAYVGRAYVRMTKDVTDRQGAVPQYRFEVAAAGDEDPVETVEMVEYADESITSLVPDNQIWVNEYITDARNYMSVAASTSTPDAPSRVRIYLTEEFGGALVYDSGWMGNTAQQLNLDLALADVDEIRFDRDSGVETVTDPVAIAAFKLGLTGAILGPTVDEVAFAPAYGATSMVVQIVRPWNLLDDSTQTSVVISEPDPAEVDEPYLALPEVPGALLGLTTGTTWFTPFADGVGIVTPGTATLDDVIVAIGAVCKMAPASFDTSEVVADIVRGLVIASQGYTGADAINSFRWVYRLDALDADGQIHFIRRGGAIKASISEDDLVDDQDDVEQEEEIRSGEERRTAMSELPLKVSVYYPNPITGYTLTPATSPHYGERPDSVTEIKFEVPVVLDGTTEAPQLADIMEKVSDADAQGEVVRVLPESYAYLTGSDNIELTERGITRRYRIEKDREGEGRKRVTMRYDRVSNYTSYATQEETPAPPLPPSSLAGPTVLKVMNSPGIVDSDDRIGVRIALGAPLDGWSGATIQYSADDGETWTTVGFYTTRAIMGTLLSPLPYASPRVSDWVNRVHVQLFDGRDLESLTLNQMLREGNGAAIIKPDSQVELLQYQEVTDLGGNVWELGNRLIRGRLGTDPIDHGAGAYFVTLASTIFIELPSSLIGRDLLFRAPGFGVNPEAAESVAFTWDPMVGQRELPPVRLHVTREDGVVSGTWIARHRFGTPRYPVQSPHLSGFRVRIDDGAETVIDVPAGSARSFSVTDTFGPSIDVSVAPVNTVTGEGPAITETGVT